MLAGVHLTNTLQQLAIYMYMQQDVSCPKVIKGGAHMSMWGGHFRV